MVRLASRVLGWTFAAACIASALGQTSESQISEEEELAPVTSMNAGSFHTVVIIRDSLVNVVKDWGANGKGQLGLNDTKDRGDNDGDVGDLLPEVYLGTGIEAVAVTAGLRHTAAIMNDDTVRAWGYNRKGQLGIGNIVDVGDLPNEMGDNMAVTALGEDVVPRTISAGGWHTCSIVNGNLLKCWGYNQWGELGLDDNEDRGDEPNEMGDNLPFVNLGDDAEVEAIALGDWHTCVLLVDGQVSCFGKNYAGQLGLDDTNHRGDDEGEMGNNLQRINLGGKKASAIACGEEHSCAILEDGELRCWGLGSSGQLGQGDSLNVGDDPNEMSSLTGIDLGTDRTAVAVAAGGNHTCARLDNDDIKCWGENDFGQLGQGDVEYRGILTGQMGDNLAPIEFPEGWTVHSLSAGYHHTCALVDQVLEVAGVVCWGANLNGQIGLGISETENIGDDEDEMGEALQMANLGGDFEEESGDEWYEETWFYIVCGVVGAVFLCCLCLLCRYAHGDNSGRGTKPLGAGPKPAAGAVPGPEGTPTSDGKAANVDTAVGRPLGSNPLGAGGVGAGGVGAGGVGAGEVGAADGAAVPDSKEGEAPVDAEAPEAAPFAVVPDAVVPDAVLAAPEPTAPAEIDAQVA